MKFRILLLLFSFTIPLFSQGNAVQQDDYAMVKKAIQNDDLALLKNELKPEQINDCIGKYSLLSLCIKVNAVNSLNYLIDQGALLENACNGKTPLMHATQDGKPNFLKILVDKGADFQNKYKGKTALQYAEGLGHAEIVNYFKREKGFDFYHLDGIDGPYILGDTLYTVSADNEISHKKINSTEPIQVLVNNKDKDQFEVRLKKGHASGKGIYKLPKKLLAISDIEGNFDGFYSFLLNNKVIDKDYNWTFGDGHLVLGGDFVDRGEHVTQVLWLIYGIEEKAEAAGGKVHFVLGNHEVMNLQGDIRYVKKKYVSLAQNVSQNPAWDEAYRYLFSSHSELGKWMRSKNAIEKIGDYIFVHAGLSPEILKMKLSIAKINSITRKNIDKDLYNNPSMDERAMFLMSSKSPLWYRGFVSKQKYYSKATTEEVDQVLDYYKAKKIIIGHTLAQDITQLYNGKVIMIDVHHSHKKNTGGTKGLLIEEGVEYKINDLGEREKL